MKSGRRCSYLYDTTKMSFYRCFNAVFNRSKNASSELLSIYLLINVCIPILTYSLEATAPNRATFHSIEGAADSLTLLAKFLTYLIMPMSNT